MSVLKAAVGLVQKAVQVTNKNGTTFTRQQMVRSGEAAKAAPRAAATKAAPAETQKATATRTLQDERRGAQAKGVGKKQIDKIAASSASNASKPGAKAAKTPDLAAAQITSSLDALGKATAAIRTSTNPSANSTALDAAVAALSNRKVPTSVVLQEAQRHLGTKMKFKSRKDAIAHLKKDHHDTVAYEIRGRVVDKTIPWQ
jgi:hypothetical protein